MFVFTNIALQGEQEDFMVRRWYSKTLAFVVIAAIVAWAGMAVAQDKKPADPKPAAAEDATIYPVPDYSGDFLNRSYLTGDWGGLRSKLAEHGVQFEVDLLQIYQGVTTGGTNETSRYSGVYSMALKLDVHKAGLWPGAFLYVRAQAPYGNTVNTYSGGIMAVNTPSALLLPATNELVLPNLYLTQFFSKSFGIQIGKLDLTVGDANEFAHTGTDKFMNLAFSLNPVLLRIAPAAALGMTFIYLPNKDIELVFSAFDTEGRVNTSGFDTLGDNSTTIGPAARFTIRPFGLTGHQSLGFLWANGKFTGLNQDPRTIIGTILGKTSLSKVQGSWAFAYNFDQYLYTEKHDPSQGFGIFGRAGVSDKLSNPFWQFYSIGFGGIGTIPTRDKDRWGIGYYYLRFSNAIIKLVRDLNSLDKEQGGELFYNIEALPWLHITPNLQIIGPSRKTGSENIDTSVVLGLRVKIDF